MSDGFVKINRRLSLSDGTGYALMSDDGYVDATAGYIARHRLEVVNVYAPIGQDLSDLPLPGSNMTSDDIDELEYDGRLIDDHKLHELLVQLGQLYRVEDYLNNCSWMVSFDELRPGFRPGQVYLHQPNGQADPAIRIVAPGPFRGVDDLRRYLAAHDARRKVIVWKPSQATGNLTRTPPGSSTLIVVNVGAVLRGRLRHKAA